ncbi:MAG: glycosyltransferase family 61 protein [Methylacidiphilales bacterium]|nr:glycosyltransferase family 61 protein [Candidatus Methylacidiphilales bacterium]
MSVGRRLQRLVAKSLPGELRWRGFRLAAGEIELRRLDPAFYPPGGKEEKRGLPENFDTQRDEAVIRIDNGYATDHGATLTSSGQLLRELSREWNPQPYGHGRLQKPVWLPRAHQVPEAASITLEHNGNYCHFLFEGLPRLRILRRCHPDPALPVYANTGRTYQRELLPLFGVGPERLIPASDFPLLQAERLWVPTYAGCQGKCAPEAISYLRETLLPKLEAETPLRWLSRKIYVSRRDATSRRIQNEAEIEKRLAELGFECLCLSDLPVLAQIRAFAEARVVVTAHGASLTNIAFTAAGALMVEIFPDDINIANDCYQDLAKKVGVKGVYFKAPSVSVGVGGLAKDLTIPETLYEQIIALLKTDGII